MRELSVEAKTALDTAAALIADDKRLAAEALLRDAARQARAASDEAGHYRTLQALADSLRSREQRVEAVPVYLQAIAACKQAQGTADALGRLEASLVFTLVNIGLPDQAAEHAAAGLALADAMTVPSERIRVLNAVALTNTRLGDFIGARRLYAQIVREGRGVPGAAQGERGRALINLGVSLNDEARTLDLADPRRARLLRQQLRCNRGARAVSMTPGDVLAARLNSIEALVMLHRLDEASGELSGLDAELRRNDDTELRAFATALQARVGLQCGELDHAAALFEQAISLFLAVESLEEVPGVLEELSKTEEARGRLAAALAAERRASAMRRARVKALSEARMKVVDARHELELARRASETQRAMEARIEQQRAQLKAQTDALSLAVRTDPLTALGNRRMLEEVASVLNEPSGVPFSVALIDVDHFKRINDTFSHAIGDRVLQRVADIVRDNCRPTDVAARYGGEEFALVLPGMTRELGTRVSERLRMRIEAFDWSSIRPGIAVTVSIGLSCAVCPANLDDVLARADECLYAAKNAGRNRLCVDERG